MKIHGLLYLLILLILSSCIDRKEDSSSITDQKPTVAVVNYPLYYFAKTIGGDHVTVYLPAIGGDPAYWKLSSKQVINFQKADLILTNGAGYAQWIEKASLPLSKIVNTSALFKDQWIETELGVTHSHGPDGEHVHKGTAFTTWLNFKFAIIQAESVHQALVDLLPELTDQLNRNFNQLRNTLLDFDERMEDLAERLHDEQLVASHPVYQYLERGYSLSVNSMHWDPKEMPAEDQWKRSIDLFKDSKVRIMIWEDDPTEEIKLKMDELGVLAVVFDPCSNKPVENDLEHVMNQNLQQLEKAIQAFQ